MKPLRTALFVPGNREDRACKALSLDADAVILDLEDAVPFAQKVMARTTVRNIINTNPGKRIYVRVNSLSTSFCKEDINTVVCGNLSGIIMPKVESPNDIAEIDNLLTDAEKAAGIEVGFIELLIICESARGLEEIYNILSFKAQNHKIATVLFGAADFTLDLGINLTKEGKELEHARMRIPVACRAAGIDPPLDTPWMIDINDLEGLVLDAKKAKSYGFQGKLIIHPNQIKPCNEIFTPTDEEISYAQKIVNAFEQAENEGKAAIQVDGKFIDYPIVEKSRRIIELARNIERVAT